MKLIRRARFSALLCIEYISDAHRYKLFMFDLNLFNMSFINKLLSFFGFNPKSFEKQLNNEIMVLKDLQLKSLQPSVTFDDISPIIVLNHTGRIKEIITYASKKGLLTKDDRTINYVLNNILEQEKLIKLSGNGYINNISIYSSQVGASISEIVKDLLLLG